MVRAKDSGSTSYPPQPGARWQWRSVNDGLAGGASDRILARNPSMYLVRCAFKNRFGAPFHWDFAVPTDDHEEAISEALLTFWDGLTRTEREDAARTLEVLAHSYRLPDAPLPVR